jgi:toxin YoeB
MRKTVDGSGKPAPIKGDLQDYWSRGITSKHRFVCKYENEYIIIAACRFYYKK